MTYKKFIPCIYLYKGDAVKGFSDSTIIDTNPVSLARFYSDNNADELIVYDMSEGDTAHEEALDIIKAICSEAEIPVIGAGNVQRMEDIKKLLYAGCKRRLSIIPNRETLKLPPKYPKNSAKIRLLPV